MKWIVPAAALVLAASCWAERSAAAGNAWTECENFENRDARIHGCTAVIDNAAETAEGRADAYYFRANAYAAKGDFDKALVDYGKAIGLAPNYSSYYASRCWAYAQKGNTGQALQDCDKAVSLNPGNALALSNRGSVHEKNGDLPKAIADYKAALAIPAKEDDDYTGQEDAKEALARLQGVTKTGG